MQAQSTLSNYINYSVVHQGTAGTNEQDVSINRSRRQLIAREDGEDKHSSIASHKEARLKPG